MMTSQLFFFLGMAILRDSKTAVFADVTKILCHFLAKNLE